MIVYEKKLDNPNDIYWIAFDDANPSLFGLGSDCNEALDDLTMKLRALMKAVLSAYMVDNDCEEGS